MRIIILLMLSLSACGTPEQTVTTEAPCPATIPEGLLGLQVGDDISQVPIFMNAHPSTFNISGSCSKNYVFNQYNSTLADFCYYRDIDTTCAGIITSIYRGGH